MDTLSQTRGLIYGILLAAIGALMAIAGFMLTACEPGGDSDPVPAAAPSDEGALPPEQAARVARMAASWGGEPVFGSPYDALDPHLALAASGGPAAGFDPADPFWGLPRTEGYEAVFNSCSGCHSLRTVMQQRLTAAGWDSVLTWMVEQQGMPPLEPDRRAQIIVYLTRHYGA